jgi:hypothetical protein
MTDHPTDRQLDDMVDEHPHDADVAAHVAVCPACGARLGALRSLRRAAESLPREMEPPRESWTAIRAMVAVSDRAAGASGSRRGVRMGANIRVAQALAAAIVLVVLSASVTARVVKGRSGDSAAAATANASSSASETVVAVAMVDRSFEPTLRDLTSALNASRASLNPSTIALVERNLKVIDGAIAEVRGALARDPGNSALVHILKANYQQKVDLLLRASELEPNP